MTTKIKQTNFTKIKQLSNKLNATFHQYGGGGAIFAGLGGLLILVVVIIVIYTRRRNVIKDPIYFHKKPHLGTGLIEKPGSDIRINPAPYSFTWHMFIYVPDWKYRYGLEKFVVSKGLGEEACPSVYLDRRLNNIIIRAKTTGGKEKLIVRDVNIRKWFHLAIVVQDLRMESYIDGRLRNTLVMKNVIQTNNDSVYVSKDEGFEGYLYKLSYTNKVLAPDSIYKLATQTPPTKILTNLPSEYK